jgi:putative peptidoglycan lipid II flippase
MSKNLTKKSILTKTAQFGIVTLFSRIFGIIREILKVRFLGIGAIADAFIIAERIPHVLRKIFAEGALSASFVPVFVRKVKTKELENPNGLMTISFLFFEGIVFLLCLFVFLFPHIVLKIIAPGFSAEQVGYAIPFLRILFPLIFFISSSALLAGALNAVNHFFIPAFGPVLLNIVYISSLLTCLYFRLSVYYLCVGILFGGFLMFLMHMFTYFRYHFSFSWFDEKSVQAFKLVLKKFIPSLVGVSIIEINMFFDVVIASFLPKGSVSLIYYSGRFVGLPVGVFAIGFATVLLPQFSRIASYAKGRFNFYVLETAKFISFFMIPAMLFFMFVAEPFFKYILLRKKATPADIWEIKWLFIIYATGLVFFCVNKVLVNIFYSLHDTKTPTFALAMATVVNFVCNVIGMLIWGSFGIVGSTAVSAVALTGFFFMFLKKKHNILFYSGKYFDFFGRYVVLVLIASIIFLVSYFSFMSYVKETDWYAFFTSGVGYWLLVGTLAATVSGFIFLTRRMFGIKLYFLSR